MHTQLYKDIYLMNTSVISDTLVLPIFQGVSTELHVNAERPRTHIRWEIDPPPPSLSLSESWQPAAYEVTINLQEPFMWNMTSLYT